jgi:hypothetical protein
MPNDKLPVIVSLEYIRSALKRRSHFVLNVRRLSQIWWSSYQKHTVQTDGSATRQQTRCTLPFLKHHQSAQAVS